MPLRIGHRGGVIDPDVGAHQLQPSGDIERGGVACVVGVRLKSGAEHRHLGPHNALGENGLGQLHDASAAPLIDRVDLVEERAGCGPADPALREAAGFTAIGLSLVAPYRAEEMWEQLGHAPSVANAAWPVVDPTLRADETVTLVVQVQGKVRAKLEVPVGITEAEATAAALADANVERALAGRAVRQVIVRLPKMVSIVPA